MTTLISADQSWMLFAILVVIAAVSIRLEHRYLWAAKVSACVLCLVFAMALANLRVIPTDAAAYDFIWSYLVPLAIPFLLFQADFRKIWRESGRMFGIFILGSLGTAAGGILAYMLLRNVIGIESAKPALAMFVGTYVGGSVNLVAMADAAKAGKNLVSACRQSAHGALLLRPGCPAGFRMDPSSLQAPDHRQAREDLCLGTGKREGDRASQDAQEQGGGVLEGPPGLPGGYCYRLCSRLYDRRSLKNAGRFL